MILGFEEIRRIKRREPYISYDFYRVAKSALSYASYQPNGWVLNEVLPEVSAVEGRVDLVIIGKQYQRDRILLIVECKQRVFNRPGPSYASATEQGWRYAKKLDSRFFLIYDGWMLLAFQRINPYLVGSYSAEIDNELNQDFVTNLLVGLMEFEYSNKTERLSRLPKIRDPDFLEKKILPSISKSVIRTRLEEANQPATPEVINEGAAKLLDLWKTRI